MTSAVTTDLRTSRRANVFLAGVLRIGGSSWPVRIRNLSATGALVDGKDLPEEGHNVRLHRGPHSADATIVWRKAGACGLRFETNVPVQEWIAYATAHSGQQRVDEIIASVRAGASNDPVNSPTAPADCSQAGVAGQLHAIAEQLKGAADELTAIPAVVAEGTAALQQLDIATQKLAELSSRLRLGR